MLDKQWKYEKNLQSSWSHNVQIRLCILQPIVWWSVDEMWKNTAEFDRIESGMTDADVDEVYTLHFVLTVGV